jgi:hypothetical protein
MSILQVGDYDGDFVADLGIYRPSTRAWWTTDTVFFQRQFLGPMMLYRHLLF